MCLITIKFVAPVSSDHRGFRRYGRLLLLINHKEISKKHQMPVEKLATTYFFQISNGLVFYDPPIQSAQFIMIPTIYNDIHQASRLQRVQFIMIPTIYKTRNLGLSVNIRSVGVNTRSV